MLSTKQKIKLAAGTAVALALLALFLRGVEWQDLGAAFRSAHPGYLAAMVVMTGLAYAARAWRWGFLLKPLASVPFPRLFSATVVGFMTGLLVPRAGEVVRPYLISRRYGVTVSAGFASIIIERLVDLITVLGLFGLYLYVLPAPEQQVKGPLLGILKGAGLLTGAGAIGVVLVLLAFHVYAEKAMAFFDRLASRLPARLAAPLTGALRSFGGGLAVLKAPLPDLAMIALQSLVVWLAIAGGFYFNNLAFGVDLPFHSTFLLIAFLTVGVAIPTPGMVGGFHEFYRLAMVEVYGVENGTAVAAGIIAHALANLPVLVFGLLFLGGEGLSMGRVAEMTASSGSGPAPEGGKA